MRLLKIVGQELYAPDKKQITSVKTAIRRGGLTYICCFLCCIAFSVPPVMAEDTTFVPLKDWWEYTDEEKRFLRDRWTNEKVGAVVTALKEKKPLPDFVDRLPERLVPADTALSIFHYLDASRLDLRGIKLPTGALPRVVLEAAFLDGANLRRNELQGADFVWARLQGADLHSAHLDSANLWMADLQGAKLSKARLQRADLHSALLDSANLWRADLQGADLRGASLQDADLLGARFDTTYLRGVDLGKAKNIRYIVWGDSLQHRYFIGEEKWADSTKTERAFRDAEITYRDLKSFYEKELMYDIAAEFHFRENEVITKRLLRTSTKPWKEPWDTFLGAMRFHFLKLTYGYGSLPWRLLRYSLGVIAVFSIIFYLPALFPRARAGIYITEQGSIRKKRLTRRPLLKCLWECFYFSLLAFATFGYGAMRPKQWLQLFRLKLVEHEPVGWIRIFVGIEAALGIWVLALLVTVLFGR